MKRFKNDKALHNDKLMQNYSFLHEFKVDMPLNNEM